MPVTFIFVRHGEGTHNLAAETEGNAAYSNEAHRDARLTEKGIKQTRDAGAVISAQAPNVVAVWSSPLTRCIQTATHILESVKVPAGSMFLHDYLLERQRKDNTCNFRAEVKEINAAWPQFKTQFLPNVASQWTKDEPQHVVKMRMTMILEHLKRKYTSGVVVVVSHYEALYEIIGRRLDNAEFVVWE
jgi:broad specificity phosphatase PhoE